MSQIEAPLRETQMPRSFLRDLVALSSLPEVWTHRSADEIASGLAGILLNMLYVDIAYVTLITQPGGSEIKAAYTKRGKLREPQVHEVGKNLEESLLRLGVQDLQVTISNPLGDGLFQAIVMPIGVAGVHGHLIAASKQSGFPDEFQHLLLRIAANHAAIILGQKAVQEELRYKQEELTDFFENASEALHWVGPDGIILWANQAELDMLGYTREEYIGQPIDKFHADTVVAEDIIQRLVNGQPVDEYEARLRCKDGTIKHVLISSSVYRKNGEFIHTRCFTRDITERKQMEETLRRAYDDIEMRVKFRTKELSAAIEALQEEVSNRKSVQAEITELRSRLSEGREAERLFLAQELHDGPIQDLFALSYSLTSLSESAQLPQIKSIQDGVMEVVGTLRKLCEDLRPSNLISHGLEKAIESHLEQFKEQYPTYKIHSELNQNGSLPERISLALYRIYQQALANIIRHAQADEIFVRFQIEADQAVLEVRDNGRGFAMPATWLELARQGHLGLIGGLERAEAVGGKLTVDSAPGKGTSIQVKVPINS
jgi:PAS domain S-box-containing protein